MKPWFKFLGVAIILFFCGLMLQIIVPYLVPPFPTDIDFLLTKQAVLPITTWRYAFYIHITSSLLTLASGITQFSRTIYRSYPLVHRRVGQVYLFVVLFLSAPSGLVLSFYSNGGMPTHVAFGLLSVLWWLFTLHAYRLARAHRYAEHANYMLRSYALTWSAVTLRVMQFGFGYFALLDYQSAYLVAAWLGWLLNLLVVEIALYAGLRLFR